MAIPNFFKQTKPRGFNYTPRYYDPKKEEWEARRAMSGEQRAHFTPYRSRIVRGSMKNYFPRQREKAERNNMIRLIVIVLILIIIAYFFLRF